MNRILFAASLLLLVSTIASGADKRKGRYPAPKRFEKAIAEFEATDAENEAPKGAILCIGSSSMRLWHESITKDLAPLTLIPRGFGGSNMNDLLHFADRVVLKYRPRAILLYEGDNDIAAGVNPGKILETFKKLVAKVHATLPATRFYLISIKPSIKRLSMWPKMVEANRLLAAHCAKENYLTYIDTASSMLGDDGQPNPKIFKEDKLHMNPKGYQLWTATIKPILMAKEAQFEK